MFIVRVADNFHYMNEDHVYTSGEFATWDEAVSAARHIVDQCLSDLIKSDMTADQLYQQYVAFGEDPFVIPTLEDEQFSAWEYAKHRCAVMCG